VSAQPGASILPKNWQTWPEPRKLVLLDSMQRAWYRAFYEHDPVAWVHDAIDWGDGGPTDYQVEAMARLEQEKRLSIRSLHGAGKAQPLSLLIDTPAGQRKFGDLEVGEEVFGADGKPTLVTGVFERGEMEVYRVSFSDGSSTLCTRDHLWTVRAFIWGRKADHRATTTVSLGEIMDRGVKRTNGAGKYARKWTVPTVAPLMYAPRWVPVDPYTLGAWLGDGTAAAGYITGADPEVPQRIRLAGYEVVGHEPPWDKPRAMRWSIYGLAKGLRRLGLLGHGAREKFIPVVYLENAPEFRRDLLRGLLDTDGTVTKEGGITFCSTSRHLAEGVAWLARSLGGMARVHPRENRFGPFWIVALTLPDDRWFYIERKQERVKPISQKRYLSRWIDNIEAVGSEPVRCISVAATDGLYVANDAIVTHNSSIAAFVLLWFATTRDGDDWKAPTTASRWLQLQRFLWPEIHKWARKLRWDVLGREPFDEVSELQKLSLSLRSGEAFAAAPADPSNIEGGHADRVCILYDEAKSLEDELFEATEGAFAAAGADTGKEAYGLVLSTPGESQGPFYEQHRRSPKWKQYAVMHITLDQVLRAGRVSREWVTQRAEIWGEDSPIYKRRVLGEFAQETGSSVIPLEWVEKAVARWEDLAVQDTHGHWSIPAEVLPPFTSVGWDVAGEEGVDQSVLALRHQHVVAEIRRTPHGPDLMEATGEVTGILNARGGYAVVDSIGVGAGPVSRLRELGKRVVGFNAAEKSDSWDASGELQYANKRAEAWFGMRDRLQPERGDDLALPPDDQLIGDLTAPRKKTTSAGKLLVESKDEIRKRLGRSTDTGDAVVMPFAARIHRVASSSPAGRTLPSAGRGGIRR
jgi:hypothetical protein